MGELDVWRREGERAHGCLAATSSDRAFPSLARRRGRSEVLVGCI